MEGISARNPESVGNFCALTQEGLISVRRRFHALVFQRIESLRSDTAQSRRYKLIKV